MKNVVRKKLTKYLTTILVTILLLNNLIPNFALATTDTEGGGWFVEALSTFTVYLGDSVMQWLQNTFKSKDSIKEDDGKYNFQYSPAMIFAGKIPAFDINFIKPNKDVETNQDITDYIDSNAAKWWASASSSHEYKEQYEAIQAENQLEKGILKIQR